ncbi:hypothetical protein IV203_025328 [Nitzschia inconspicua]|uniref:Uncharacterized protein n=1 Tax=Nitzschia inconspicua TaxID=303405 RepID=A0A9K3PC59_9STRA|nr:hypothetical protein IV203_024668 [Nitzschia inconspicua]KAG7362444.1 hypothetical protein IV203_025328 [Nitzschia inconspicua]
MIVGWCIISRSASAATLVIGRSALAATLVISRSASAATHVIGWSAWAATLVIGQFASAAALALGRSALAAVLVVGCFWLGSQSSRPNNRLLYPWSADTPSPTFTLSSHQSHGTSLWSHTRHATSSPPFPRLLTSTWSDNQACIA